MGDSTSAGLPWVFLAAIEPRSVRIAAFIAILFFANFLANYYVLYGGLGDERDQFQSERVRRSLISGARSTCLFPISWLAIGSLLETYL